MAITIGQPLKNNAVDSSFNRLPNVDESYGPYTSVAAANTALPTGQRAIGLTVGIKNGNTIKEYWYNGGVANNNLVEKTEGGSTPGGGLNLEVASNVTDTTIYLEQQYPTAPIPTIVVDEVLGGVYIKYKEGAWIKTEGVILGNSLPQIATITGVNFLASK